MHQDWGRGEGALDELEHSMTLIIKDPGHALACQMHKGHHDLGVSVDELTVEICETKEGLHILDLLGLGPILNGFDFLWGHRQSSWRQDVAEVLGGLGMELTFLWVCIESMLV